MAPAAFRPPEASPNLNGEDLAIRFVNTIAWRLRDPVEERLDSPWALLDWLHANGIGRPSDLKTVSRAWKENPQLGFAVYEIAIGLREAIYEILVARIRGRAPLKGTLAVLNKVLSQPSPTLRSAGSVFVWQSRSSEGDVRDLLSPIAFSAVELITGVRSARVRQCQDDRGCGWLFVDESRAQNRRWCSMGDCGNRAKAHRHYKRVRLRSDSGR
jgi:predicted RNA-binding Zn ribbon-like protein